MSGKVCDEEKGADEKLWTQNGEMGPESGSGKTYSDAAKKASTSPSLSPSF
jgi:hypothetical protein